MSLRASIHTQRLERWVGAEQLEQMSRSMRNWYGPPIAVANVPGLVWATRGGDFCGRLEAGYYMSMADYIWQRFRRGVRRTVGRAIRQGQVNAGFTSLSDLISEATAGAKMQQLLFRKSNPTAAAVANATHSFNQGVLPPAGGVGGTSGTGRVLTSAATGALKFVNPTSGDTTHLVSISARSDVASSFLLYDRLWDMTYNHATALSTAIDANNRPNRYQTAALAPGNFVTSEITTALSATAHNITVTYVDQDGNTAEAAAAYAAAVSAAAGRVNTPAGTWFVTLNSPDTGARYLTNIAQSTITSVTGVSSFLVGHPLALIPVPAVNVVFVVDGINSAFNMVRIYDDACLAFMTPYVAATGVIVQDGLVNIVSG